jgi:hypothetical protein
MRPPDTYKQVGVFEYANKSRKYQKIFRFDKKELNENEIRVGIKEIDLVNDKSRFLFNVVLDKKLLGEPEKVSWDHDELKKYLKGEEYNREFFTIA